ncbi:MAG: hypothetical protein R3F61_04215 [Myxococcota bacterium]
MLVLTAAALASGCETPFTRQSLGALLADAEVADRALAIDDVLASTAAIRDGLPCAAFRLEAAELASFYRLRGWALFTNEDAGSRPWLATAYGLQPAHPYSPPLPPAMQAEWDAASAAWSQVDPTPLAPPASGTLVVNGRDSAAPVGLPWVLQHFGPDGAVRDTWLVAPGDPVPTYEVAAPEPMVPDPVAPRPVEAPVPVEPVPPVPVEGPVSKRRSGAPGAVLAGVGAVGVGAGAALWTGANLGYARYCVGDVCPAGFYEDRVQPQRTVGIGTAAVGSALFATGVAWLATRTRGER